MHLFIAQHHTSVVAELQLRFPDTRLTSADKQNIYTVFGLIEELGSARFVLPVGKLSLEQQQAQRVFISRVTGCHDWNNFLQKYSEMYNNLRRQEQMILPYIPYFELGEMVNEFNGEYTKGSLKTFRRNLYDATDIRDKAGYIPFLNVLNIEPIIPGRT
jgi:hypothetical protein